MVESLRNSTVRCLFTYALCSWPLLTCNKKKMNVKKNKQKHIYINKKTNKIKKIITYE